VSGIFNRFDFLFGNLARAVYIHKEAPKKIW
jgi:hypothetical protein